MMSKTCTAAFAVMAMATLGFTQVQAQGATRAASSAPVSASAKAAVPSGKSGAVAARGNLDLQTPPLNRIMPKAQLRYILASEDADAESATEVSVKGTKSVIVPGAPGNQLQAIPWALFHPMQAWRIFTPLEQP
jgi:hypothetical protein